MEVKSTPADVSTNEFTDGDLAQNPFLDPKLAEHYSRVYEQAQYEGRHVFDPQYVWTAQDEKKVVRKLDLHVTVWVCVMFFALQEDRKTLGQALAQDLLTELNMTTDQFNLGNIIYRVSFLAAELPSQLLAKKLGPDRWIPAQMTMWSIVTAAQASLTGSSNYYATRSLLGLLQGGFFPNAILWMSYFFTSSEVTIRLSICWTTLDITAIVISLIAYGILHLNGVGGLAGWRWLFLIEGLIGFVISVASWFMMPASAVSTKAWYRPKGWFKDDQIKIAINRLLRDDPSKGDMNNRMPITPRRLWKALTDYDLWPIYIIGAVVFVPMIPPATYLTLTLRNLGFSSLNTILLTIPNAVGSGITLIAITLLSERVNERSFISMIQNIWALPCLAVLRWWSGSEKNAWGTYSIITVLLSYPYAHAILIGWALRNSNSGRTRSISVACYNIGVQLGDIYSTEIYRTADAPLYHTGNTVLFALDIVAIALFVFAKVYYIARNRHNKRRWDRMTEQERRDYLDNTTDEGNKRLDFRFSH